MRGGGGLCTLEKGVGPLRVSITVILRTADLFRGCQDLSSGPKFFIMLQQSHLAIELPFWSYREF